MILDSTLHLLGLSLVAFGGAVAVTSALHCRRIPNVIGYIGGVVGIAAIIALLNYPA